MNAKRDSRGRFGPGNCANPNGGPKKDDQQEAEIEQALEALDAATPILVARAFERAELGERELFGPALSVLAEIMRSRNLETEQRMRDEVRLLHAEMTRSDATTH